ncbi:MAG: hypothetical protein CMG13_01605 [Candidatus Marinimicrobia bacterium]|nr:hypothetical protein [Candidatus Neomarinimicrobiota bacterium]
MLLKIINSRFFLLLFCLFLVKCDQDEPISFNSSQISTQLDAVLFSIDESEKSYSYQIPFSSLDILDSPKLYASSDMLDGQQSPYSSSILFSLNLNDVIGGDACQSGDLDLVSFSLTSLNRLVDRLESDAALLEDGLESDDEYYIDSTGVSIWAGDFNWDGEQIFSYENLDDNSDGLIDNLDASLSDKNLLEFHLENYSLVINVMDQAENSGFLDLCNIQELDFLITYNKDGGLGDEVKSYIELLSSDYSYEPAQPRLALDYRVLEEETVSDNKFVIDGIQESYDDFYSYIVDNVDSDYWGRIILTAFEVDSPDSFSMEDSDSQSAIIALVPEEDIEIAVQISIDSEDILKESFLPINFYLDEFIAYSQSDDPAGDNLAGEGLENNSQLDWLDLDENGQYDYGEELLEAYDDFGFDGCLDSYELDGGCSDSINELYNPSGTEGNEQYDTGEIFSDCGEDNLCDIDEEGYDPSSNLDPAGDNYNIDPSSDNWNDCGSDGDCDIEDEDGTQGNGIWNNNEGTENNNRYDSGESFFDIGSNGIPDDYEESPGSDNWNDCGSDGDCDIEDEDGTQGNGVWDDNEGTEGNGQRDNGESYYDYGSDNVINYLENGYSSSGTEGNNQYDLGESFDDIGSDGCANDKEFYNSETDETECLDDGDGVDANDPSGDNYLDDINGDNWNDCGSDGDCDIEDEDGTQGNGVWDDNEGTEGNGQVDWSDDNLDGIIDLSENSETWYDYGADNISDDLEFLSSTNYLEANIVHDLNSYVGFSGEALSLDIEEDLIDGTKDVNVWISSISETEISGIYNIVFKIRAQSAIKAIDFKFKHLPYVYLDNIYNNQIDYFYNATDTDLIKDISVYPCNNTVNNCENGLTIADKVTLDYHQGIETVIDFEGFDDFIVQDKTFLIDENYSNLFLYIDHIDTDFEEGYSDIYYKGVDEDIFLKRIYYDGPDSVMISVGGLIQKFVDKEIDYNGFELKIGPGGYDFNTLNFHRYSDNPEDAVFNPRIEIMYSK